MSNDSAGRTGRTTSGNGPVGSTVAIVVTAIALILGFLILRKMNDDSSSSDGTSTEQTTSTSADPNATTTTAQLVTTTTEPPLVTTGTKVQAANCSTQNGAASFLTTSLSGVGFITAEAANCSPTQAKLPATQILYNADDPNAQAVAESLGRLLGGVTPEARSNPVPNESGVYPEGCGVLVLIGDDIANKTLDQIAGKATTGTTAAPTTAGAASVTT